MCVCGCVCICAYRFSPKAKRLPWLVTGERKGQSWSIILNLGGSQLSFIMKGASVFVQCDAAMNLCVLTCVLVNAADEKRKC